MNAKILSFGAMYLDIISTDFPHAKGLKLGTETVGKTYTLAPGGSALNFARVCTALKLQSVFIGKRGTDPLGDILEKLVRDEGITPAFIRSSDFSTNLGINYIGDNHTSLLTVVGSANQSLSSHDIEAELLRVLPSATHLYLGGCFKLKTLLKDFKAIIELAKKNGLKIILDHGRINNMVTKNEKSFMQDIISYVDYYFPSKDEFLTLWQVKTIEEGLQRVRKKSQATIIVKDAENGVYGMTESITHVPAFRIEVQHPVGAGDSFNAGFIKGQTLGFDFVKSMQFGCATAALKISRTSLPTDKQVLSFIEKHD